METRLMDVHSAAEPTQSPACLAALKIPKAVEASETSSEINLKSVLRASKSKKAAILWAGLSVSVVVRMH